MNAEGLRVLQAPFKDKYAKDAEAAMLTLKVEGALDEPAIACKIDTGRALVEAGLHRATGGSGMQACSGDMLLEALVACAGVTVCAMATTLGIDIRSGTVKAEGDVDLRGVLAVNDKVPVAFQTIRLSFDLDSDADEKQLASLIELTERYCVIYQTLRRPPAFDMRFTASAALAL
ncbi:OsmC family protein [Taklimakanibacter deserti]|uniref:OsmC family protein n=1 Tax=Taklimakanibacter deserti TaxID=2267839 RepID=UPI000E64F16F